MTKNSQRIDEKKSQKNHLFIKLLLGEIPNKMTLSIK